jgi:hypothetical protein
MNKEHEEGLFPITLNAVVLDCRDINALSEFYLRLLGWEKTDVIGDEWIDIEPPFGGIKISFQRNDEYETPVWPEEAGSQQQMVHLDFTVKSLEHMKLAVEHALGCGAVKPQIQFGGEEWVTLLDPSGHPFCFVL